MSSFKVAYFVCFSMKISLLIFFSSSTSAPFKSYIACLLNFVDYILFVGFVHQDNRAHFRQKPAQGGKMYVKEEQP